MTTITDDINNVNLKENKLWEERENTILLKSYDNPTTKNVCAITKSIKDLNGVEHLIDITRTRKLTEIDYDYIPTSSHNKRSKNYIVTVLKSKYNRLKPLNFLGFSKRKTHRESVFRCQCDCGRIIVVKGHKLSGKKPNNIMKSCGCIDKGFKNARFRGYGELSLTKWNCIKNTAKNRKILFNIKIEDGWKLFIKHFQ